MKNIHKIFPDIPTFSCFQCFENVRSLLEYAEHINNEHGLPILDLETHEVDTSRPRVSSISNGVNYYEFELAQGDLDIMEYLFRNRGEISKTVQKNTSTGFHKRFNL